MPTYDYLGINNLSQIPNPSWQIYQTLKPKDIKTIPNHNKPIKYIIRKERIPYLESELEESVLIC